MRIQTNMLKLIVLNFIQWVVSTATYRLLITWIYNAYKKFYDGHPYTDLDQT